MNGSFESVNPATGQLVQSYPQLSHTQLNEALESAEQAQKLWSSSPVKERVAPLRCIAELLLSRKASLAELMTEEMGKVKKEALGEIEKCAWVCRYYAEHSESFLNPEPVDTEMSESFISLRPLGVVLAIMPWNFPFWQVFRFAAPALAAGDGALLKHAPNVCGTALAIEKLFLDAGFPRNLFRSLLIDHSQTALAIESPVVKAVTLTGSVRAGRSVAELAGKHLKKTVLELGGSDPYLVLEDADLELAAQKCAQSRLLNCGQSCIAAKRLIVVESVSQKFAERLVAEFQKYRMGDPGSEETNLGPMVSREARDELHRQVHKSVQQGADCLLGGALPEGDGAFYPPTVLTGVKPGMPAFEQELFGPVAAVIEATSVEHAVELANNSPFGLGGAIFTSNLELARELAIEKLECGCCAINDFVKSDPRLPFGGIKNSGYGRELSHFGQTEFVNIKTVTRP